MKILKCFSVILSMLILNAGCNSSQSTAKIPTVRDFTLEKYLGTWYEIARMPHSFERDLTAVKAEYSMGTDGKLNVVNCGLQNGTAKRIEGIAEMKDAADIGYLRVSFFRPFYGDYRIIHLAPDYTWAVVTSDTMDYLWILARSPDFEQAKLNECLDIAEKFGFNIELLQYPNSRYNNNKPLTVGR